MALSDREKEQLFRLFIQQSQGPSKPKTKREPQGFFERTKNKWKHNFKWL